MLPARFSSTASMPYPMPLSVELKMLLRAAPSPANWGVGSARAEAVRRRAVMMVLVREGIFAVIYFDVRKVGGEKLLEGLKRGKMWMCWLECEALMIRCSIA
jgi:hypothetical protein